MYNGMIKFFKHMLLGGFTTGRNCAPKCYIMIVDNVGHM